MAPRVRSSHSPRCLRHESVSQSRRSAKSGRLLMYLVALDLQRETSRPFASRIFAWPVRSCETLGWPDRVLQGQVPHPNHPARLDHPPHQVVAPTFSTSWNSLMFESPTVRAAAGSAGVGGALVAGGYYRP